MPALSADALRALCIVKLKLRRLPHSILFQGSSGTGKTYLSQEVSSIILNFYTRRTISGHVSLFNHPDFYSIAPIDGIITLDLIQKMKTWLTMTPVKSRYKVLLINDIDKMNIYGCNAFLKTLEEPIGKTYIFMNTTNLYILPQTIISRCMLLKLKVIDFSYFCKIINQINSTTIPLKELYFYTNGDINVARLILKHNFDLKNTNFIYQLKKLNLNIHEQLKIFIIVSQKLLVNNAAIYVMRNNVYRGTILREIYHVENIIQHIYVLDKEIARYMILRFINKIC